MLKNGWEKVQEGDFFIGSNGTTKYQILAIAGDAFGYADVTKENTVNWGRLSHFSSKGLRIIGSEWAKAEDAVAYLEMKGFIKNGKVINS